MTGEVPAKVREPVQVSVQVPVQVACLCAAWCRVCEAYAAVFDEVRRGWPAEAPPVAWHWVDVEDESDLVGDLDIATFPMILVADAAGVRFAGPVAPDAHTLARLLRALVVDAGDDAPRLAVDEEVAVIAQRLLRRTP